jgi:hypothetical protein
MEESRLIAYFNVHDGSGREVTVNTGKPTFIIGNDSRCDLPLSDPAAAPSHAVVSYRNGDYFIKPRYTNTPIWVNGVSSQETVRLMPGAEVQIGSTLLTFDQEVRSAAAMVLAQPVKAAVVPKYVQPTPMVMAAQPARPMVLATAGTGERAIFFPEIRKEPSVAPILIGYMSVIGIIGLFIHILLTQVAAANATANPYAAYADGTVQIWVFHADW